MKADKHLTGECRAVVAHHRQRRNTRRATPVVHNHEAQIRLTCAAPGAPEISISADVAAPYPNQSNPGQKRSDRGQHHDRQPLHRLGGKQRNVVERRDAAHPMRDLQ